MRIRSFVMSASATVAIAFFALSYFAIGRVLEHSVREDARQSSAATANLTFAAMYELMSTGWNRRQAEQFLAAIRGAARDSATQVDIYRGPVVVKDFGEIQQSPIDDALRVLLDGGAAISEAQGNRVRYVMPLVADERCLGCHVSAKVGTTLGAIEVRQDSSALIAAANRDFLYWLLGIAPVAMAIAGFVVWQVNRRLEQSVEMVNNAISQVKAVGDLRKLEFERQDLGFDELNRLFGHLGDLVAKLREVAVDKDVLRFEIGLVEKFVITSDVVRDWGDYVTSLLADINQVMMTPLMFSVFQTSDDALEVEVFWLRPPEPATRAMVEAQVRRMVDDDARFERGADVLVNHHVPQKGEPISMDQETFALRTKSLIVDQPKIGGIVGIGVHCEMMEDETLRLVTSSILSTMLNVVGSVKAIHKYTRDIEYYATRDPLTDLYNRRVFWDLFEYEVSQARRHEQSFALLLIDLDNFKLINDNFGHTSGDAYLQVVARAMKRTLRPGDIMARYGGDEFVALLSDVNPHTATLVAQRVLEAAGAVVHTAPDGKRISGSVSIGLALFPTHAESAKDLFLFADNMLYKAKLSGKQQLGIPGDEEVAEIFRDMTAMTMTVVNAINEKRIVPFYQPILDITGSHVAGYEVLSRMEREGEYLEASRFIEYAEKAGAIDRLDNLVTAQALQHLSESGFTGYLFVNLSPRVLVLPDFPAALQRMVTEAGVDPRQIVLEITERDTLRNVDLLERGVNALKREGFKLAIDDFGSGFSSFQYLRRLPVDFVKIEGDFVANILGNPRDRAFVQTIWRLATDLKIKVIAEHVESAEVLEEIKQIGVEFAQGYFVGRPAPKLGAPG